MPQTVSAEERRDLWGEAHVKNHDWDYGQWIVAILWDRFEAIENIIGPEKAAGPLLDLLSEAMRAEGESASDWREALEKVSPGSWSDWRLAARIHDLGLYAIYGVTRQDIPVEERGAYIKELLTEVENFVATSGLESILEKQKHFTKPDQITKIANLARARWNIDHQQDDVDPASLAILGGLSEGRVRNLMSGQVRVFENVGGRVTAASALAWLQQRPDYYASIWDQEEDEEDATNDTTVGHLSDVVFVPMAQDRSIFHPGLARSGRFQIGPKGAEFYCDSFESALYALQHMPDAYWRRPNPAGNWSIVKATEWARVERAALQRGAIAA